MIAGGGVCDRCNVEGMGFYPTDEVLVRHLKRKILDPDSDHHYIRDIKDLSQFEPPDLLRKTQKNRDGKEGYFFWWPTYNKNNQISRKCKNGYWGETGRCVPIDSGEESVIAKRRAFVFFQGVHPGTRTPWFIYQYELAISHPDPIHQDKKEIFLCKLVEHKQKDRLSGSKRKAEHNAKARRARKDNSLRKKAKVSSAQEAQLHDEHNNNILTGELTPQSYHLPSESDSSILTGELTPQSHHLPSKYFSSNNMPEGDHHWSPGGLHPSNGFPGDVQIFNDNQQCHHLSSNSINGISTGVGMQPSHHFPSSTPEENSNEDPQYNEQRKEGSQLSCHLDPENDIRCSELLQRGHHLPSNCEESIESFDACEKSQPKLPTLEGGSLDCMDEDTNDYLQGLSIEELEDRLAQLEQPQPPTTPEVHGTTNLSRGADQLQDQRGNNEGEYFRYMSSFSPLQLDTRFTGFC